MFQHSVFYEGLTEELKRESKLNEKTWIMMRRTIEGDPFYLKFEIYRIRPGMKIFIRPILFSLFHVIILCGCIGSILYLWSLYMPTSWWWILGVVVGIVGGLAVGETLCTAIKLIGGTVIWGGEGELGSFEITDEDDVFLSFLRKFSRGGWRVFPYGLFCSAWDLHQNDPEMFEKLVLSSRTKKDFIRQMGVR